MNKEEKKLQKALGTLRWYRAEIWKGQSCFDDAIHMILYVEATSNKEARLQAMLQLNGKQRKYIRNNINGGILIKSIIDVNSINYEPVVSVLNGHHKKLKPPVLPLGNEDVN